MNNKQPTPISIKDLKKEDIGRSVIYNPDLENDYGRIKSWTDKYVFVVYPRGNPAKNEHYDRYTASATNPEDLVFKSDL